MDSKIHQLIDHIITLYGAINNSYVGSLIEGVTE